MKENIQNKMTMKSDEYEIFRQWCRNLYDENCLERHRSGLPPYENFEDYYHLHLKWLEKKYNDKETRHQL